MPVVFIVTDAELAKESSTFFIYPNPVNNKVLTISGGFYDVRELLVVTMDGELILKQAVTLNGDGQMEVELPPTIAKGLHFLVLIKANNSKTKKFIIE